MVPSMDDLSPAEKVSENRLRRVAERRSLRLMKSRRRDRRARGFGTYMLVDADTEEVVAAGQAGEFGLTLNEIEEWLDGE